MARTKGSPKRLPAIFSAIVIALVLVATSALYFYNNRKETIVISVTVNAPYGGVFASGSSCSPLPNYLPLLSAISVTAVDQTVSTIPEAVWRAVDTNRCTRDIVLALSPDQEYSVAIGSTPLGTLDAATFITKRAEFLHSITVLRDLHGVLQLKQKADSCSTRTNGWYCSWSPTWQVSLKLNEKAGTCSGTGGYDDIKRGASVKIYSSSDDLIASSEILSTSYDLVSIKSRVIYCEAVWHVIDVPNDDGGYYVEISNRGKVYFAASLLQGNGWTMNTELGE